MKNKVHEILAEKIISALEQRVIPWQKPWGNVLPQNAVSKHKYQGYNLLLASISGDVGFITYNQAKASNGKLRIKKEELSNPWLVTYVHTGKKNEGEQDEKNFFFLRYYKVYGLSQLEETEDLAKIRKAIEGEQTFPDHAKADKDVAQVTLSFGGNRAFYRPATHSITIPNKAQFKTAEGFYKVLFHELTHYLAKEIGVSLDGNFGNEPYAKEELVAEIGANLFASHYGIDISKEFDNSIAYIQNWKAKIQQDNTFVAKAAKMAQDRFKYWIEHYAS